MRRERRVGGAEALCVVGVVGVVVMVCCVACLRLGGEQGVRESRGQPSTRTTNAAARRAAPRPPHLARVEQPEARARAVQQQQRQSGQSDVVAELEARRGAGGALLAQARGVDPFVCFCVCVCVCGVLCFLLRRDDCVRVVLRGSRAAARNLLSVHAPRARASPPKKKTLTSGCSRTRGRRGCARRAPCRRRQTLRALHWGALGRGLSVTSQRARAFLFCIQAWPKDRRPALAPPPPLPFPLHCDHHWHHRPPSSRRQRSHQW